MGNLFRKYFAFDNKKVIATSASTIILITFLIILNACGKNNNKEQILKEESPSPKLNINCTGYIKGIFNEGKTNYLIIDTVELFTGDDAIRAFNKDKRDSKNKITEITNGYYIRNIKTDSLKFRVSDSANVVMQTLSYNQSGNYNFNEKIGISKFISLLKNEEHQRFKFKLYRFQIINDEAVSITEIYLP